MNISDILRTKQGERPDTITITPGDTVADMVAALIDHDIGALVVVGDDAELVGVVSERDIVRRLTDDGPELLQRPVREIMTSPAVSCAGSDAVDTVAEKMTQRRVRHMPVVDDGRLIGLVSIGDVVFSRIRQLETDRGQLEQYISG